MTDETVSTVETRTGETEFAGNEKESLPSIKSTRKDVTKTPVAISSLHKVQLLVEILTLLDLYKAHSIHNTYNQWRCVQDALERKPLGRHYRRMDKPYCFKKKVLNAVDSWVSWAECKGYPSPRLITNDDRIPPFVKLVYKVHVESKSGGMKRGSNVVERDEGEHESEFEDEDSPQVKNEENEEDADVPSGMDNGIKERTGNDSNPNTVTPLTVENRSNKRMRESSDDGVATMATTAQSNDTAEISTTIANVQQASQHLNNPQMRLYLEVSTTYMKTKAQISEAMLKSMKAKQEDDDIARLESLEEKITNATPGSILHVQYIRQRDRCLTRLHGKDPEER